MEGIDQIKNNTIKIDQNQKDGFEKMQGKRIALTFWLKKIRLVNDLNLPESESGI